MCFEEHLDDDTLVSGSFALETSEEEKKRAHQYRLSFSVTDHATREYLFKRDDATEAKFAFTTHRPGPVDVCIDGMLSQHVWLFCGVRERAIF